MLQNTQQATKLVNTRPLNENPNIYQFMTKNNQVPYKPSEALHPAKALFHYMFGNGEPLTVDIRNVNLPNIKNHRNYPNFSKYTEMMKTHKLKGIVIDARTIDTKAGGLDAASLGNITIELSGTIRLDGNDRWRFEGSIRQGAPDTYDFNKSTHRDDLAEHSTTVGRKIPGKKYKILFEGIKHYEDSGSY